MLDCAFAGVKHTLLLIPSGKLGELNASDTTARVFMGGGEEFFQEVLERGSAGVIACNDSIDPA